MSLILAVGFLLAGIPGAAWAIVLVLAVVVVIACVACTFNAVVIGIDLLQARRVRAERETARQEPERRGRER